MASELSDELWLFLMAGVVYSMLLTVPVGSGDCKNEPLKSVPLLESFFLPVPFLIDEVALLQVILLFYFLLLSCYAITSN